MEERAEMYYNNNVVEAHLFPPCLFEAPSIIITLSPVATINLVSKVPLDTVNFCSEMVQAKHVNKKINFAP